jgi:hypothetical protein
MSDAEAGLQRLLLDMFGPRYLICPILWHPRQIPSGGYKRPPTPPQLSCPLSSFENTLNQPFLSSKSLSLKIHSNLSFLREIWAILLSDPLNLQASTSSMIFVCSFLLGTYSLDGLGVVRESPSLWWISESLYCPLLCEDLIVENWTRSW